MRLKGKPRKALIFCIFSLLFFNRCVPFIEYQIDKVMLKFIIEGSGLTADVNIEIIDTTEYDDDKEIRYAESFNSTVTPWVYDHRYRTDYNIYCFQMNAYEARLHITAVAGPLPATGRIFIDGNQKATVEISEYNLPYTAIAKFAMHEGYSVFVFACDEDYH